MTFSTQQEASKHQRDLKSLLGIGAVSALLAAIIFRRNIAAEVSLISNTMPPETTLEWFTLLQHDRILGLILLDTLDIVNYLLVGVMLLTLWFPLKQTGGYKLLPALYVGLVGIIAYIASNPALSLLSLSDQYATATSTAVRDDLLLTGDVILAATESTGKFVGLILIALTDFVMSLFMMRSDVFSRATAYSGLLASLCDFGYFLTISVIPMVGILFVSAAGLLLMIWHILIGRRLYLLSREDVL
jgi:hypothetical protein